MRMAVPVLFDPAPMRRRSYVRTVGRLRSLLVLSAVALPAIAATPQPQVFRCEDADGHIVFSDTMCGTDAEKVDVVESSGGLSAIEGDGLSDDERSVLKQAAAREAQRATAPSTGPVAPAPAPSVSRHSSY
jgi:hypothetical protein